MVTRTFVTEQLRFNFKVCEFRRRYQRIVMRRDVFQAISDPIRREILDLLVDGHLNVNSIAGKFDVSRPAISKHIKILVECGLVVITKNGRERFCELDRKSLVPAFLWMDQFKKSWEDRMDRFEDYINKQQSNENKENG